MCRQNYLWRKQLQNFWHKRLEMTVCGTNFMKKKMNIEVLWQELS